MAEVDWARSSVDVMVTASIPAPVSTVARYASDPGNAPLWYDKIDSVEWKTAPPVRVGTLVAFVARFLGRELRYTYEVVDLTPTSLVMRTAEGPFPMETSYRFDEAAGGGTHMTMRNRGTPSGFSTLVAPVMRRAMRRAMRADLEALTAILGE